MLPAPISNLSDSDVGEEAAPLQDLAPEKKSDGKPKGKAKGKSKPKPQPEAKAKSKGPKQTKQVKSTSSSTNPDVLWFGETATTCKKAFTQAGGAAKRKPAAQVGGDTEQKKPGQHPGPTKVNKYVKLHYKKTGALAIRPSGRGQLLSIQIKAAPQEELHTMIDMYLSKLQSGEISEEKAVLEFEKEKQALREKYCAQQADLWFIQRACGSV